MNTTRTPELHEVVITGLNHEGRGITHLNGKVTFVDFALPEERVKIKITKSHRQYNEAEALEILEPAATRVAPLCPHFTVCGGCSLQHLDAKAQIAHKQKVLLEQCKHFGQTQPENILPPLHSPITGYRHKARLGVRFVPKKNKLLLGFHERNGRYVADLQRCPILAPNIGEHLEELRECIASLSIFANIAQVEVAVTAQETVLILRHLKPFTEDDLQKLISFAHLYQMRIDLQPKGPDSIHSLTAKMPAAQHSDQKNHLLSYPLERENLTLNFAPQDFTQINPFINEQMVNSAIDLLELSATEDVVDLFCGSGNFSLALAKHARSVIGVEGSDAMVQRATENAQLNDIGNAQFFQTNLQSPKWALAPFFGEKYDKLLLDPPRTGALDVCNHIERLNPKLIVYIACDPATLARDIGVLVHQKEYFLRDLGVMDMFPHTRHLESIAVLMRNKKT